jgi:O-acetylhomoserine/O-acetylserine sulfhydrylase-like pyridoxal-dependent enzyme
MSAATAIPWGCDRRQRHLPWSQYPEKFPGLNQPEPAYHGVVYTEKFGPAAFIARARTVPLRNTGAALAPMNAFLLLQGLETLALRMERHRKRHEGCAIPARSR